MTAAPLMQTPGAVGCRIKYTGSVHRFSLFRPFNFQNSIAAILLIVIVAASVISQTRRRAPARPMSDKPTARMIEARRAITEAKSSALKIKSDYQRGLVLDDIGAAQAKAGLLDAAVVTANRAFPFSDSTMTAIGKQLGNSNDLVKAKALGLKFKGGSSSVFSVIARSQAEKGKIDEALRTTRYIQVREVRRYALERIAQEQAANLDYAGTRKTWALAIAAYPRGLSNSDDIKMIIATSQLTRGDVREAEETIASLKSPEMRFGVMISGADILLKRGDKAAASSWLEKAFKILPAGSRYEFLRYVAIPIQVKLDANEFALKAAEGLSPGLREKGYMAIAVVCAETKDVTCVKDAVAKMQWAATSGHEGQGSSEFGAKLMTLNVTAALIDNDQFEAASELLTPLDRDLDEASARISIEPRAQLQRVFIMARQNLFEEAHSLAQQMGAISTSDDERGTAFRSIALLQTKKLGAASSQRWASALTDPEDRAYALLGVAEGLLDYDDPKLHYSVIQIH